MEFSISVFGEDRVNYSKAIFASFLETGPPADLDGLFFANINPSIIAVSSIVPPNFLTIFMFRKSTFVSFLMFTIFSTESTAKGDSKSLLVATILELKAVLTHSIKVSLSFKSTSVEISIKIVNK